MNRAYTFSTAICHKRISQRGAEQTCVSVLTIENSDFLIEMPVQARYKQRRRLRVSEQEKIDELPGKRAGIRSARSEA